MIRVADHLGTATLAFADERDVVLFRLFFPEVPANRVPQPHADDWRAD